MGTWGISEYGAIRTPFVFVLPESLFYLFDFSRPHFADSLDGHVMIESEVRVFPSAGGVAAEIFLHRDRQQRRIGIQLESESRD